MHKECRDFCASVRRRFPDYFEKVLALDIGSGDVNGNNNFLFKDSHVLGVDLAAGPNVGIVAPAHELPFVDDYFQTIISTECFEHDRVWEASLKNIVRMLRYNGLFLFTCATTGRPEHGTSKSKPYQVFSTRVEGLEDYYRNLTEEDIRSVLDIDAIFHDYEFSVDHGHCDLFFWGIKK